MLAVLVEFPLVHVALLIRPLPESTAHPANKAPHVSSPAVPSINTFSMRLALFVLPNIFVAVDENLVSLTVFEKILKCASIGACPMTESALAILLILLPFSLIVVAMRRFPLSIPIFHPISPLTYEHLSIIPLELPFTMSQPVSKLSYVNSIQISLRSFGFLVFGELPFEDKVFRHLHPFSIFLVLFIYLPKIH